MVETIYLHCGKMLTVSAKLAFARHPTVAREISVAEYTLDDLLIIDDQIEMIRARAAWFGGEPPRARWFAANLVRDLIFLEASPVRVERVDHWWIVYADRDWLKVGDSVSLEPFFKVVAFSAIGVNSMRSEVVIAALADAVLTIGVDGVTWITGDRDLWPLPPALNLETPNGGIGRILAFAIDRGA